MPELSAYHGVTLDYGSNAVVLRPSLRAASRLESLHDGFPNLLQKVQEFDTQTIRIIITYSAGTDAADRLFAYFATQPLSEFIQATQAPIFELINALLPEPTDDDKASSKSTTGTPMPWSEVYKELYGYATGWMGWTPETAWDATPQEISDAFAAHVTKLKAIHGSPEDDSDDTASTDAYTNEHLQEIEEQGHDPAFQRGALHALKSKGKP